MNISRRKLFGMGACGSLLLAQEALGSSLMKEFLKTEQARDITFRILRENFGLTTADQKVAREFHESLVESQAHGNASLRANEALQKKTIEESLEILVMEEFVVSTNFFAWKAGEEGQLAFIGRMV